MPITNSTPSIEPGNYVKKVADCHNNVGFMTTVPSTDPSKPSTPGKQGKMVRGICAAQTCRWIKTSLQLGDVAAAKTLLKYEHQTAISHAAWIRSRRVKLVTLGDWMKTLTGLFDLFGLKAVYYDIGPTMYTLQKLTKAITSGAAIAEKKALVENKPSTHSAYCFAGLNGHALGFKMSKSQGNFLFEPELGLYEYDNDVNLFKSLFYYLQDGLKMDEHSWSEFAIVERE